MSAIIYDFDGLILDTEWPVFNTWREIYREHGAELTLEQWGVCVGRGEVVFDPHGTLEGLLGRRLDGEALKLDHRNRAMAEIHAAGPLPGVVDRLDEARERGWQIGLASSSDFKWVGGHLERLGLLDRFACIRTKDNVARTKPAPDLFLAVMHALDLDPRTTVVFEDSPNGIIAAKEAGAYCVAVPNAVTRALGTANADRVVESLAHVTLEELEEVLASRV